MNLDAMLPTLQYLCIYINVRCYAINKAKKNMIICDGRMDKEVTFKDADVLFESLSNNSIVLIQGKRLGIGLNVVGYQVQERKKCSGILHTYFVSMYRHYVLKKAVQFI